MKHIKTSILFVIWVALFVLPIEAAGPPDVGYYERADCTTLNAVAYQTTCKNTGSGGTLLQGMMYVYNGSAWQGVYPSITEDSSVITTSKDLTLGTGSTETLSKAQLTALKTKSITFVATSADDGKTYWRNNIAAMTVTEVWCLSDTSTAAINVQRDDGSPANILSSDLTCTTSGATGTIDTGEDNLALTNKLVFQWTSGSATTVTVAVKATID